MEVRRQSVHFHCLLYSGEHLITLPFSIEFLEVLLAAVKCERDFQRESKGKQRWVESRGNTKSSDQQHWPVCSFLSHWAWDFF